MADESSSARRGAGSSCLIEAPGEAPRHRRRHARAAERNTGPILDVLKAQLPERGRALEVASGTGQHAAAFACAFPGIEWWPSDPAVEARDSISAWIEEAALGNLREPLSLDVTRPDWSARLDAPFDAVLAINLLHVSPWAATLGLLAGAAALLAPGGLLYIYGAFARGGAHVSESNAAFDAALRAHNPDWGVRDVDDVEGQAQAHGLALASVVAMPANNFSLLLRKA